MDINTELFKRYQPKKKLEIIESLSPKELMAVSESTAIRIVKEVGSYHYGSKRDKKMGIRGNPGNDWNSTFEALDWYKGKLYVELYYQYENTDTTTDSDWSQFFKPGTFHGQHESCDRMGNPRTYYFSYSEEDKARCMKSLLLEYVHRKYNLT